jgi:antitoxin component YwqK of YwqJK toxin-antitoxin module
MRSFVWILLMTCCGASAQQVDRPPLLADAQASIAGLALFNADSVLSHDDQRYLKKEYQELTGAVIRKEPNGEIREIRCYTKGRATSRWYTMDSAQHVVSMILFEDVPGKGYYRTWNSTGSLRSRGPIDWNQDAFTRIFRGMTEGIHETFYPDGTMRQVMDYRDGNPAKELDYYPTGQISQYRRDSLRILICRQWCPNGQLVGELFVDRRSEHFVAKGSLVLVNRNSGEPFDLKSRRNRWILKSRWDGERLVAHSYEEVGRMITDRHLDDGSFQDADELPWMMRKAICK